MTISINRSARWVVAIVASVGFVGCNTDKILEVDFPGQIPTEQINDPSLAAVLARSVIGDFECAYSNYMSGSSVHSDEYETSNSNVPLANWGERTITADENDYSIGTCEGNFGMNLTLHTARFQSEDASKKLAVWTDQQVPNRALLQAQAKIYGAYSYLLMGEGFCKVAFDGGPEQEPAEALKLAETRFGEGLAFAQAANNADMLNLGRVGMARTKLDLKKFSEAATFAAQVTAGYNKNADRGQESNRRWNKLWRLAEQIGAYTVATAYRNMNDPRVLVRDAGRGAFNSEVRLWVTTKYTGLTSPLRLASGIEANLIQAEALIQQNQVAQGMALINARRAATGVALPPLVATTQAQAMAHVIDERRKELSFEGGHRLNDLLRFRIAWKVGANPFTNRNYGTTTCWPHPTRETLGV
ncbi:MAG: RagB/SusD family nutrient uptake outer membrane protein [Gemmatimonadaceae bacterium]